MPKVPVKNVAKKPVKKAIKKIAKKTPVKKTRGESYIDKELKKDPLFFSKS